MKKSIFLITVGLLLSFVGKAQQTYDNEKVKSEVKTILSDYEKTINAFINLSPKDKSRRAYSKKLKENFESTAIWVYNDLDTNALDTTYLKMFEYIKGLPKSLPFGSQIKLDLKNAKIEDVVGDKARNGYTLKVHVKKTIETKTIVQKEEEVADSISNDTIITKRSERLTFHFKIKYFGYTYKGPKVSAISKWKVNPKYRLLPKAEQWWVDLSPEWQGIIRENTKLQEFPDKMDLDAIGFIYKLDLSNRNITSVKPLARFTQLKKLVLTGNPISSLEGVENCSNLAELYINETGIKDLKSLEKLNSLQILHCEKLGLESLEGVSKLVNLIELDCSENLLKDIEPLKNMNLLEVLDISLNQEIESVEALRNKPNLKELSMRKMKVTDLSPISGSLNMTKLDFFSNEIGTLAPISRMKKLAELDCSFAKISSLQPLSGHTMLVNFNCAGNAIDNINVVKNFYALKRFNCSRTSVSDLSPIMTLRYLQRIDIFDTEISVSEKDRFKRKHSKCKILYY